MSPLHPPLKIAIVFLFLCLFVCFGFWLGLRRPNTHTQNRILVTETLPRVRLPPSQKAPSNEKDFYRVIIDNNLFRPLGWTPPRQSFPYRLIGTLIPTDGETSPVAILGAGQKTHTVTLSEKIGGWTIQAIAKKQVTLEKDGQRQTLRLATYHTLTPNRRTGHRRR